MKWSCSFESSLQEFCRGNRLRHTNLLIKVLFVFFRISVTFLAKWRCFIIIGALVFYATFTYQLRPVCKFALYIFLEFV